MQKIEHFNFRRRSVYFPVKQLEKCKKLSISFKNALRALKTPYLGGGGLFPRPSVRTNEILTSYQS